jgi:hypothetical protein
MDMTLPASINVKINFDNYKFGQGNLNLECKFKKMPFFHQLGSGRITKEEMVAQLLSILKCKQLYCDKELKEKNIKVPDNTYDADRQVNRDEYIYLMLGRVVTKPTNKQHISIEFPHDTVSYRYDDSFFCNDPITYDLIKYTSGEVPKEIWKEWEQSVLDVESGIKVLADYTEQKFQDNNKLYLHKNSFGDLRDILKSTNYPEAPFVPEFATKRPLFVNNLDVRFHVVGFSDDYIDKIKQEMEKHNYNINQLIEHKDYKQFVQYLERRSGL